MASLALVVSLVIAVVSLRSSGPAFSNGTLFGAYVFNGSVGAAGDIAGTASFDGVGNVSGTFQQFLGGQTPVQCSVIFSGTYSVDSAGIISMTAVFTPGDNCVDSTTRSFIGAVNLSGKEFLLAESDVLTTGDTAAVVGIKQ